MLQAALLAGATEYNKYRKDKQPHTKEERDKLRPYMDTYNMNYEEQVLMYRAIGASLHGKSISVLDVCSGKGMTAKCLMEAAAYVSIDNSTEPVDIPTQVREHHICDAFAPPVTFLEANQGRFDIILLDPEPLMAERFNFINYMHH